MSLAKRIMASHLVEGTMIPGADIVLKVDQTLTQDATGTMVYLELEAMGFPPVATELSVSYVDHNTLQTGFENADDHVFLQTAAARMGIHFSRAGNGVCHQVHLERFGAPGKTLVGADSHTPHAGGLGMLAFGAGGLDVAMAMVDGSYHLRMPEIVNVRLKGEPGPWVSAKDVILELLRRLTVEGGLDKVFEYSGPGLKHLSVYERATIANMGAELGATSSIFPSDANVLDFLTAQGRQNEYIELTAEEDDDYDNIITVDLSKLEPLVALPHSPDNVERVADVAGTRIDQVFIGSCTNSSYADLSKAAKMLDGKTIPSDISLVVAPGSRQVLHMLAESGALASLVRSGARILECACGPCLGIGQAPKSGGVSLRTSNRNFQGRSGTRDAAVYLTGVETAVASALSGVITDPRELGAEIDIGSPKKCSIDDSMIVSPASANAEIEIIKGPNIKSIPKPKPWEEHFTASVLLKVGDNITTDHILPAGAKILPLRSNIPAISAHCFEGIDPSFSQRAIAKGVGIVVAGSNYGQGSSREHAVLAPLHLGVRVVIAKSFARIHRQNLINFGILPLQFRCQEDYGDLRQDHELAFDNLVGCLDREVIVAKNMTTGRVIRLKHGLYPRQIEIIRSGGLLYCR